MSVTGARFVKTVTRIPYNKEFDEKFRYDGKDLGATCTEEGTIFKVWCPLADSIKLHLYQNGEGEGSFDHEMTMGERGTWYFHSPEKLHGTFYDYTVIRGESVIRTADPYARACGINGTRSMVVDLKLTDPEGFDQDMAPKRESETIIYELHIKDFSHDADSGVEESYRGKYKAFTVHTDNSQYPTCVEYLKKLGVTHVHLLPMYDYGWLDEKRDDDQFNWGYDPVNYNVPEGSFATDPYDGTVRIRECKEMIQALHKNGIRVVMDVVYNHTYESDSWLERMVPGYYIRRWEDGRLADGSACGNDIACGRTMVDHYIADSVMYWAKEYHVDGFRFDLMGLLTVELMNRIRKELDEAFGPGEKLLYGEPWRATESPMEEGTNAALKCNVRLLDDNIAIFSDDTRDVIKGHVFYEEEPGFVNGGRRLAKQLLGAVSGWCGPGDREDREFSPKSCNQIINYVSAHDNFTLWDKLVLSMHGGYGVNNEYRQGKEPVNDLKVYTTKHEDVLKANKLAALIYFTCQGHIFLQAGEEFGRTKYGDGNSYRSHPSVNMLRWHQTVEFAELLEYYKGLIRLRKRLPGLCDKSCDAWKRIEEKTVITEKAVSFKVSNRDSEYCTLWVIYNAGEEDLPLEVSDNNWYILADIHETDCCKAVFTQDGWLTVAAGSGMILGKREA